MCKIFRFNRADSRKTWKGVNFTHLESANVNVMRQKMAEFTGSEHTQ